MFGLNWGNGFITDQNVISSRGLSDPNAFFLDLLNKPYVNKVGACKHARGMFVFSGILLAAFLTPLQLLPGR